MIFSRSIFILAFGALLAPGVTSSAFATEPVSKVVQETNRKMVKLFGAGGFSGAVSYGTGFFVSPKGHILTISAQLLDTVDLRVHLHDGRRYRAKVLVREPQLDVALLQIDAKKENFELGERDYFDLSKASKLPAPESGDWALALSNQFNIATREEFMTVQQGTISSIAKLSGRRGIFDAPYEGEVIYLDQITNNPGSAGGAVVNLRGELSGIIGKEFRNRDTDTWINYAMPLSAKFERKVDNKTEVISIPTFVELGIAGKYISITPPTALAKKAPYHGILFVPEVVEQTPAYVDQITSNSPAAKAGLKPDDLITYMDGEPVYHIRGFKEMMKRVEPNTTLKIEVRRGEKIITLDLTVLEPK